MRTRSPPFRPVWLSWHTDRHTDRPHQGRCAHGVFGLLAETDASMFAIYCQACADWLQLTRYLNRLGPLKWYSVTESGYRRMIPELQVRDRAFQILLKLGTRFGLDSSSRAGLGVVADKSPNFVEEFLFKPRVIE